MTLRKRVLLKNKNWALALIDSVAEVTIVSRNLLQHLEVKAPDNFVQVETADMLVSEPDRVYKVTLQLEGDIERTIHAIFWDRVVKVYDILLAEKEWPPDFVRTCPYGEEVIKPSFSPLVPEELAESYSIEWALAQAPALYRNHVGWDRDSQYHVIPFKSEPQPQPQNPIKHEARAPVRQILTQLEYQGVIEPCLSPMNNPLFPVAKPDHSYRIVLDYRHLNGHTRTYAIQNSHSTALMSNIVRKKYKTTLDISNEFFCQNIVPESRDLTSFSALGSQNKSCCLPQGYKNSPGLFAARVTAILHEIDPEALSCVDDIYLTDDELLQHLRWVARIVVGFAELGYKFNFKKPKIAFLSVLFLGCEKSIEGKSLAPKFLEICAQLQPPHTIKKLQLLLGFQNVGRIYIPDYATCIKSLYDLICPDFSSKFWTVEHKCTLRDLQTDMLAAKHLHTRDNKTHLVIRVIAGTIGFTYVTFNEGETVPLAYKSHLYSAAEQLFAPTEKILTAVQMAVIKERPLAQRKRIIVVSPIPALEAVTKASIPNAKALHPRWIQWVTSLTATDVDYIFDPKLQTQEFLQYEIEYPVPADTLPIDQYHAIMYTDGSAQLAVGTKHQYSAACAVLSGYMEGEKFCPQHTYTQTLGDCTAQLAELKALLMALEHTDLTQFKLIVCDSYYCVQSFNEYLHYWCLNGFRDSKGNTIKHRLLWGKVADLKETLPKVHVVHTLGHQRVGIHVAGNTLADEAAKSAVAVATVAAVTRLSSKPDTDIMAAIKATVDGTPYPKGFPNKYQYLMGGMLNAEVKSLGVRDIPNEDVRPQLIKAAHEGVASAHAGVAATISLLQARYWWPGLYKETKQYVLCCDICQQIKVSTAKRPPQTPLLISNRPLQCVYLDHCGPLTPDSAYKYKLVAVDSGSRFVWVWPQRSADARTVIKDLRVFVSTYAIAAFHSDQGHAFASRAFRDTMASLGAQLQYSSPFHPEGNSVVVRLNSNLKQSLTARVLGTGHSWLTHLYGVQRALNNLPRRSLGDRTSYECLFGTQMFVLDLDGPGVEAAEKPFDINDRVPGGPGTAEASPTGPGSTASLLAMLPRSPARQGRNDPLYVVIMSACSGDI
ncbi:hypothetical protein NDU88_001984 [Pleurodeles waltl]|uniref:Gypsy retrotransposon integrase-like protein 1 n=1 Tax=Pleurodeles waltl TaxID=8319 RepID=A0AAV7TJV0_PLEWA|nr:hypothetical protein NDU88_001984 [Pleurodeles waltl]